MSWTTRTWQRLGLVALAGGLAACTIGASEAQPAYSSPSAPPPATGGPDTAGPDAYHCFAMTSGRTSGTLCFSSQERCLAERERAHADGALVTACAPQSPVSCFQLGGEDNPSLEMCAATPYDCELWRYIDQDRNGKTGGPCTWRHGDVPPAPGGPGPPPGGQG